MYQGKIPSGNYESFELSDDNKKNISILWDADKAYLKRNL